MVKYIISDLGGVILEIDFNRFAKAVKKFNPDSADKLERLEYTIFYQMFSLGKMEPYDFYGNICKYLKFPVSYWDFVKAWNRILIKPNQDYCDFLQKTKKAGYHLVLMSNIDKIHWPRSYFLCENTIDELFDFDCRFLSCEVGLVKPNPLFFAYILNQFRIKGLEAIFIDDKPENIKSAQKCGINALLYDSAKHEEFIKAVRVFLPKI